MKSRRKRAGMIPGLNIHICSAIEAVQMLLKQRNQLNMLSIWGTLELQRCPVDAVKDLASSYKRLIFDDVFDTVRHEGSRFPTSADVTAGIEFSRGKDSLIVHCHAGISRSSAMAYLIACTRVSPEKAIDILNPMKHWPNPLVVKLGSEVLANRAVEDCFLAWKKKSLEQGVLPVSVQLY